MLKLSTDTSSVQAGEMTLTLDEIAREGARRMLQAALEAEVAAYLERFRGERDERGHALVALSPNSWDTQREAVRVCSRRNSAGDFIPSAECGATSL